MQALDYWQLLPFRCVLHLSLDDDLHQNAISAAIESPPSLQYERSKAAYDVLTSSTDAKGRSIEVVKMLVPPLQFITEVTHTLQPACTYSGT